MMTNYIRFNTDIVQKVFEKGKGHCWYCGKTITIESRYETVCKDTYSIDHIIPKHKGGTDELDNLVPSCWVCNGVKGRRTLESFREVMARTANGAPKFTPEQVSWLRQHNIDLPKLVPYIFWFEKVGLSL